MRVLLDTTFARRGPSGTAVYLTQLVPALQRLGVEVVEAQARPRTPGGGGPRSVGNLAAELRWANVELPRRARALHADVLHHPLPTGGLARGAVPRVVTVHDLAFVRFPEAFDRGFRTYATAAHRLAARRADAVIAVSQATAEDLQAHWAVPRARIVVAHHGPGQTPEIPRPRRGAPRHFLYVGDDEPRKNLGLLLAGYARYRAASEAPLPLILAGTAALTAAPGVEHMDRPDRDRLAALHAEAAALVHPSLHEGFGLTPLEAMGAGTPVLAVRSAAVAEVCGDAARYVQPHDAAGLAHELTALATREDLRADLGERGRRRAAAFSWDRSAKAHRDAYALAIAGRGPT